MNYFTEEMIITEVRKLIAIGVKPTKELIVDGLIVNKKSHVDDARYAIDKAVKDDVLKLVENMFYAVV